MLGSIFLEFNLPNAATWFYFSLMLVVALFFKFNRLLSVRNWDLLTLFLLVPGLLLLQEAHAFLNAAAQLPAGTAHEKLSARGNLLLFYAYVWLVAGSGYLFGRCLFDLTLVRRPALTPNLNLAGLGWMAAALFLCMTAVAIRRMPDMPPQVGKGPIALTRVQEGATAVVSYQAGLTDLDSADARFWVERSAAMLCHLSILVSLVLVGWLHFQDLTVGMAAACLYLLLPYTAFHVAQVHHAWPTVFLLWALFCYRKPGAAGAFLGVAAGSMFFPLLLFPLWCGFYRGRGAGRFAAGFAVAAGLSLAVTVTLLLWDGEFTHHLRVVLSLSDWQAWKVPQTESIWSGVHWAYRMPAFIAYAAFVVLTAVWPTPKNLGQLIALSAAVLIGVQFWYADQGGVYVLWYLPLVLLMVFRPNLSDRRPPQQPPVRAWGWPVRLWLRAAALAKHAVGPRRQPEPVGGPR